MSEYKVGDWVFDALLDDVVRYHSGYDNLSDAHKDMVLRHATPKEIEKIKARETVVIYKVKDGYVISNDGVWLAGLYSDVESAKLAIDNRSKDQWCFLQMLKDSINIGERRPITANDIKDWLDND